MKKIISTKIIFLASLTILLAQNPIMKPETLWKLGRVNLETVSPDGKTIYYTVATYDLAKNKGQADIYSIDTEGNNLLRITTTDDSEENIAVFPEGNKIAFLRNGELFEMDLTSKREVKLSDVSMNGFILSPDGKKILYAADVKYFKDTKDQYPDLPQAKVKIYDGLMYRHWKSWEDYHRSNIFVANIENSRVGEGKNIMKEPYDSPLMPLGGMEQVNWSKNGKFIAYTCKKLNGTAAAISTNSDIFLYNVETGYTKNITEKNLGYDMNPVFAPNGRYIVYNSMQTPGYEADKNRMMMYDIELNTSIDLTSEHDRDSEDITFSKDGKEIYFISHADGTQHLYSMNPLTKRIRQITTGQHDFHSPKIADGNIIVSRNSMTEPAELFAVSTANSTVRQLTTTNQEVFATLKKATVEKKWVTTTDGKKIQVWYIFPPDFDKNKQYPTLLYCQGGPQSFLSQSWSYRWNFQLIASMGYVVVAPCRRGMPGFGQAWNQQISEDWGGQCMKDYFSAIDDACQYPYVDKNKLGAIGASFGGYSVFWLAGNHQKRFKTFVAHAGIYNFESMYGTTEEVFFENHEKGGAYWQSPKPKSYASSPHLFAQNWDTPILITHGEKDYRVPLGEGLQAFQAAQLRNIPSKLVLLPEEGHWIGNPQSTVVWHKELFGWLDKWLK
jgi:dipeptidyl aminopeptidase/acylaminoacyl peptidase